MAIIIILITIYLFIKNIDIPFFSYSISGKFKKINSETRPNHLDDECREWKSEKILENVDTKDFKAIYGEFKSFYSILKALEKGYIVIVIFGNKIFDDESKAKLKELLKKYPENFYVFQLDYRPARHASKIGITLFIEEEHEIFNNYRSAFAYDTPNSDMLKEFEFHFNVLRDKATPLTLDRVDSLETYI